MSRALAFPPDSSGIASVRPLLHETLRKRETRVEGYLCDMQ